jgi:hypothetical protein
MLLHFLRWWWCETSVLGHSVHFVLKPIPPWSNWQNIFCASYLHPNGTIFIHWNGLSDCISWLYIVFEVMVVRNQRFGTFSPFHLEINSPQIQWTKYLLCILFTPQWVHIYPLEWIIWLHFMLLHFFEVMVVRNQRFGTIGPVHLETDSPPVELTKYLLCILLTPQ